MKRTVVLCVILVFFLGACSTQTDETPSITSAPASTQPAASTPTRPPTVTPQPTVTVSPSPTSLPTRTPTETPGPTPDHFATETVIVGEIIATVTPEVQGDFISPNGEWRAEVLTFPCTDIVPEEWYENAYDMLQMIRTGEEETITAATQLQYCGGLGAFGIGGLQWSPEGRYFYFTDTREGVPDGGFLGGWHRSILRFDTETMEMEHLGSGPFSPNGERFAAIDHTPEGGCHPEDVTVRDINGEELYRYPIDISEDACWYGDVAWSLDGEELALIEAVCPEDRFTLGGGCDLALYRIDLTEDEQEGDEDEQEVKDEVLWEGDEPALLAFVLWEEPNSLSLVDNEYQEWVYDLDTGELTRVGE